MYLELRHLRSLLAISETGNLAQAAERLHLTQSALSHQIRAIEHYFDVSLFHRKHKPLRLTSAGERLLQLARQILPQIADAEYELKRLAGHQTGRLHITIECHSCYEWLLPVLDQYRAQWPEVEVDIRLGNNFDPMPALRQGDIDMVISSDRVDDDALGFEPLFDFQALCAMACDHPLSRLDRVRPADFADQVLITYPVARARLDVFSQFLDPVQVNPAEVRQTELTSLILQLVASGRGIAVLPDWVLAEHLQRHYVCARPLGPQGLQGRVYAALRKSELQRPYLQEFLQLARQAMIERRTARSGSETAGIG